MHVVYEYHRACFLLPIDWNAIELCRDATCWRSWLYSAAAAPGADAGQFESA